MSDEQHRSGFVALYGRPNVGKSTLVNKIIGTKVSITSTKAQTTRHQVRGVLNDDSSQIVFVDTPGVGKPRSALGKRLNASASEASSDVDVVCFVVDGRSGVGRGDLFLAEGLDPKRTIVVVNKIDNLDPVKIVKQLEAVSEIDAVAYVPVSAQTGSGIDRLLDEIRALLPEGPPWYPEDQVTDTPEPQWVAELVREQLLRITHDEVPHSIATRVTEWEWPRVRVEILVERESQKGIVIGKGGSVLKEVGTKARSQLPDGVFLDLYVTVDKNWQHDPESVERLGY